MKIKTIEFAKCKRQLSKLTAILKNWCYLHTFYTETRSEDAGYWYNERASISVLAAAAWHEKNWVALEEYSTRKINSNEEARNSATVGDRSGRCDLFIGSKNGNAQFAIEAKQAWQRIGNRVDDPYAQLNHSVDAAWNDARHLILGEASKRLAITFCSPSIHVTTLQWHEKKGQSIEDIIKCWLADLHVRLENNEFHGLAYCFPKNTRRLKSEHNQRIYPGTVMLIKECKKSI